MEDVYLGKTEGSRQVRRSDEAELPACFVFIIMVPRSLLCGTFDDQHLLSYAFGLSYSIESMVSPSKMNLSFIPPFS